MLVLQYPIPPQRPRVVGEEILLGKSTRLARLVAVRGFWEIEDWPEDALRALLAQAYGPSEAVLQPLVKAVRAATALLPRSLIQAANALQGLPEPQVDADPRLTQAERLLKAGADPQALATAMRREGLNLRPAPDWTERLALCDKGVVLGHGTVIVDLTDQSDGSTGLAVEGNEANILALLSVASGRLVSPDVLNKLASASRSLGKGNVAQAAIALCHIGQPPLQDRDLAKMLHLGARALDKGIKASELLDVSRLLPSGMTGSDWLKSLGDPTARVGGYSFDESKHPREGEGAHYPGRFAQKNGEAVGDGIDWEFISNKEGGRHNEGYIPKNRKTGIVIGKSGVTIATGVDLGQQDADELLAYGVSPDLVEKLRPFLGLKREEADKALVARGLTITDDEAKSLDQAVKKIQLSYIRREYTAAVARNGGGAKFDDLPEEVKTVIVSTAYQMGAGYGRSQGSSDNRRKLWDSMVGQDPKKIEESLRRVGADPEEELGYRNRRNSEADYLARKRKERAGK